MRKISEPFNITTKDGLVFGFYNPDLRNDFKTRLKYFIPKVPFNLRLALKILFGKCTIYNHYDNDYKVYVSEIVTDKKYRKWSEI